MTEPIEVRAEEIKEEIKEVKAEPASPERDAELKALNLKLDTVLERLSKIESSPIAPAPTPAAEPEKPTEPAAEPEKPKPDPTSHDLWRRR